MIASLQPGEACEAGSAPNAHARSCRHLLLVTQPWRLLGEVQGAVPGATVAVGVVGAWQNVPFNSSMQVAKSISCKSRAF